MTTEEKEKIDYEIEAKKKAKDRELLEWTKAMFFAGLFFFVMITIVSMCNRIVH